MNLFKRGYYSIIKNFRKSMMLFLVIFVLGNVICGTLAITQSLQSTQNEFRKHYGAKFEIKAAKSLDFLMWTNSASTNEYIKAKEALEYIAYVNGVDYSYVDLNYYLKGFVSHSLGYVSDDELDTDLDIYLCGVTSAQMGLFKNYQLELVEGRSFHDDELINGSKVVLVSDRYRILKNGEYVPVSVGDKITLERSVEDVYEESVEYEVIGLFKRFDNVMVDVDYYSFDNYMSLFYIPASTLFSEEERFNELNQQYSLENNCSLLGKAYFQLENANDLEIMLKKIDIHLMKDQAIKNVYISTSTNDIYKKISAPIESMSGTVQFLQVSSTLLCILIVSVSVFILIRNRKHEIGILISLGESKGKVIFQMVLEVYLVGILALGCSMISGNELGKVYSNYIVDYQVELSKDDLSIDESHLQDELLESYSFELSFGYILSVFVVGSLIILISVVIPILYIVSLKPRKILL
ncbi:MAG: ABC transporter permease [Traorella sp.]